MCICTVAGCLAITMYCLIIAHVVYHHRPANLHDRWAFTTLKVRNLDLGSHLNHNLPRDSTTNCYIPLMFPCVHMQIVGSLKKSLSKLTNLYVLTFATKKQLSIESPAALRSVDPLELLAYFVELLLCPSDWFTLSCDTLRHARSRPHGSLWWRGDRRLLLIHTQATAWSLYS